MLFKLSLSNLKKSVRDYAVYFFTIVIGVSIFYVFNAIGEQSAFMKLGEDTRLIVEFINTVISGLSVFVAIILGLLIVYASRFLMKRRNNEFALYMILGMGKGKISAVLLIETIMIGIGSLAVGLAVGVVLSQLMSAVVANLFEADMTEYRFIISGQAISKTITYFSVMYIVVILFSSFFISKSKLIDLINSGRRSEKMRLKNPIIRAIIFIISASALGYAYYGLLALIDKPETFTMGKISSLIVIGSISTLLIFYSVSGLILFTVQKLKRAYYSGLNSFTFRQISSRISTMVLSMTVICLMLFVTICSLCSTISVRNSLNENLKKCCPVDAEIYLESGDYKDPITVIMKDNGYDLTEDFSEYVEYKIYKSDDFTFIDFVGEDQAGGVFDGAIIPFDDLNETVISLSDYNRVMELYGCEKTDLNDDEFLLVCNYQIAMTMRNNILQNHREIVVFGNKLTSKTVTCKRGFVFIEAQEINMGLFVVPDKILNGIEAVGNGFVGNFKAEGKEEKEIADKKFRESYRAALDNFMRNNKRHSYFRSRMNTKVDITAGSVGIGAIATFVGLYLGLIFLVSCGAILALKQLSESADSVGKYEMLRKLGVSDDEISRSLFIQSGIFFMLPLILAIIHSYFGMKFSGFILESMGVSGTWQSVTATAIFILCIYGGYFLITFFSSRFIIKSRR